MQFGMEVRKIGVVFTAFLAFATLGGLIHYERSQIPLPMAVRLDGYPPIGQGPIELVLFEDFLCPSCKIFSEEVMPEIVDQLLTPGKARLIMIPIALGPASRPIANAAIAVYKMAPLRFLPFLFALLRNSSQTRDAILDAAAEVGGIDMRKLVRAIDFRLYYGELERNLEWGRYLMGDQFGTPSLFVNGVQTSTSSFDAITYRIRQIGAMP